MTTIDDTTLETPDAADEKPTWVMPPLPNPRGGGYFIPGQNWQPTGGQTAHADDDVLEPVEADEAEADQAAPKRKRGKAIAGGSLVLLILAMAAMSAAGGPAALAAAVAGGGVATGAAVGGGATAAAAAGVAYARRRRRGDRPGRTRRQPGDRGSARERANRRAGRDRTGGRNGRTPHIPNLFSGLGRRAGAGAPGAGRRGGAGGPGLGGAARRAGAGRAGAAPKGALGRALRSAKPSVGGAARKAAAGAGAAGAARKATANRTAGPSKRSGRGGGGFSLPKLFGGSGGRRSSGSASKHASKPGRAGGGGGGGLLSKLTGRGRAATPRTGAQPGAGGRPTARQQHAARRDARRQQRLGRGDSRRQRWTERKNVLGKLSGGPERAQRRQQRRQTVVDRRQAHRRQRWDRRDQRREVRWNRRDQRREQRNAKLSAFMGRRLRKLRTRRRVTRMGMSAAWRRVAGYRPNWYSRLQALHPGSGAGRIAAKAFRGRAMGMWASIVATVRQIPAWMWAPDPAPKHQAVTQPPLHRPAAGKTPVQQILNPAPAGPTPPRIVPPVTRPAPAAAAPVPRATPAPPVPPPIIRKKAVVTVSSSGRGLHPDIDTIVTAFEDNLGGYEMTNVEGHHAFLASLADIPSALGEAFASVAGHFEGDTPLDQSVSDFMREMAQACESAATTAGELFDAWSTQHEYDINRALDSRPGEELLDYSRTI